MHRRGGWAIVLSVLLCFPPLWLRAEEELADAAPCETCAGLRRVPRKPFKPFVMVSDGKPHERTAPWQTCPACRASIGEKAIIDELETRLARAEEAKAVLLEAHPKAFLRFVLLLRAGETPRKALETGYGKTIEALDNEWRTWVPRTNFHEPY